MIAFDGIDVGGLNVDTRRALRRLVTEINAEIERQIGAVVERIDAGIASALNVSMERRS